MEIPEKSPNLLCKKSSPDLKLMFEWHHLRSMRQCDRNKCLDGSFVLYISIYLLHIGKENVSVLSISVSANIYEIYRYRYLGIFPGICYDITFIILLFTKFSRNAKFAWKLFGAFQYPLLQTFKKITLLTSPMQCASMPILSCIGIGNYISELPNTDIHICWGISVEH